MNPAQSRSDAAFVEGILCAAACLPQPDLDILHRGLGERVAGSPITLDLPDLAEAVAACARNLEQPTPSFAFDDMDGAREWLEGLFLGLGFYAEEWRTAVAGHPGSLMATTLLHSLIKPEATADLPGVATAARDLANSPVGVIQLVQTLYRDLRRPPQLFDAWPEAAGDEGLDPEQPAPKPPMHRAAKVGRNDPCPCGSGKKFKKCCLNVAW